MGRWKGSRTTTKKLRAFSSGGHWAAAELPLPRGMGESDVAVTGKATLYDSMDLRAEDEPIERIVSKVVGFLVYGPQTWVDVEMQSTWFFPS